MDKSRDRRAVALQNNVTSQTMSQTPPVGVSITPHAVRSEQRRRLSAV